MLVPCLPDVPWPGCSVSLQDDRSPEPTSLDAGWCYPQENIWTLFEQLMANAGTVRADFVAEETVPRSNVNALTRLAAGLGRRWRCGNARVVGQ